MVLGQRIDMINKLIRTIKRQCQQKNNASPVDIVNNIYKTLKNQQVVINTPVDNNVNRWVWQGCHTHAAVLMVACSHTALLMANCVGMARMPYPPMSSFRVLTHTSRYYSQTC